MKTKNQNNQSGLGNPEQLNNNNTAVADTSRRLVSPKSVEGGSEAKAEAQTGGPSGKDKDNQGGKGNLPPIDAEKRKQNRTLPTTKVLNLLHTQLPTAYRLAEVVGGRPDSGWVWVTFKETPAAEVRQGLAQLGFHWNRERQAWQHPCGKFSLGSQADPREKYSSYYPARIRRAATSRHSAIGATAQGLRRRAVSAAHDAGAAHLLLRQRPLQFPAHRAGHLPGHRRALPHR